MFFPAVLYLAFAPASDDTALPPGDGQAIVQQKCASCHALKVVTGKRASRQQWSTIVDQMVTRGAEVSDDDIDTLLDYLAKNFGRATGQAGAEKGHDNDRTGPVNVNTASASELAAALDLTAAESTSIVSYRERNGNFKEWHDLTKVPDVDAKKIESNKDRLVF
jgi:competence ComEA-like helix-hairpin-helix protein